jgi:ribosomal subunit interface protein
MQIDIRTTGEVTLTDEIRGFVEEKTQKLEKFVGRGDSSALADVHLGFAVGGQKTGDVYLAEINLTFAHGIVHARATRETLHNAIDVAAAEAGRELRKKIGRKRDLMRRGAAKVKDMFRLFGGS